MEAKRKISVRKIIQTLLTIVLVVSCVFVMMSAAEIQNKKRLSGLKIEVKNEDYCQFVSKDQIKIALFEKRHLSVNKLSLANVDIKKMEAILMTNPWIENAQIFVDNQKQLNIQVTQRKPQLRVFDQVGNTYYLDAAKQILPISENYTHYELLFINVPLIKDDSIGDLLKTKMINLAQYIKRDSFWQAQTAHILVNSINDFQLVPVIGKHKILLGSAENIDEQLENVFAFYKNILNKIGWEKYEIIDARYHNQIVTSPSLPWKAPVDRVLTNINWVKSIVGDETKKLN
ncbi:MAG: hypothetical protein IT256_02345 [Chitinophagaceae bacterium]|nr:hypothetical protein [Chitinophagaceae bacterium]